MEKFAVDLDRVLDEFELNEDLLVESGSNGGYGLASTKVEPSHLKSSSADTANHIHLVPEGANTSFAPHCDSDNFLDLSDADFAPSLSSKSIPFARNSGLLDKKRNSFSLSQDTKPKDSIIQLDPRISTSISGQNLNFKSNAEEVTKQDFDAEKKESSLALANGLLTENGLHLSQSCDDTPSVSLRSEGKLHKTETGSNIISGIKVLHCDETINKDYVVTFGRKWEPAPAHGLTTSDDSRTSDLPRLSLSTSTEQMPAMEDNTLTDHRTFTTADNIDLINTDVFEEKQANHQELSVGVNESIEENFVTPDDSVALKCNLPAVDFISFDMDVELTDDDLRHYLDEGTTEIESSDVRGCEEEDIQRPVGEEFFTPMDENSDQSVVISSSHNEESDARNELLGTDVPTDFVMSNNALSELATEDAKEDSSDSTVLVQLHDDAPQLTLAKDSDYMKACNPSVVGLGQQSETGKALFDNHDLQVPTSETSVSSIVKDADSDSSRLLTRHKLDTSGDSATDVDPHSDGELTLKQVTCDHDDEEELCLGDLAMNTAIEDTKCQHRLQRPTSLHLSGKIEVARPAEVIDQEVLDSEAHKPFSGLMITAGSPDAGLGISPTSSDSAETPTSPSTFPTSPNACQAALTEDERQVGKVAPVWVPDAEAPNCMQCDAKFTVIKRRHHCRACGKVLCAQCCGLKAKLGYMDNKEARVCQYCLEIILKVQSMDREADGLGVGDGIGSVTPSDRWGGASPAPPPHRQPNPNNPSEYCSMIPPLQQCMANANAPPPTVMVPVGVLKRGGRPKGEPKQVMFSDGIRPGGDLTELDGPEPRMPYRRQGRLQKKVERPQGQNHHILESTSHPPMRPKEYSLDDILDIDFLMNTIRNEEDDPVIFALTKNLRVWIKIVTLECCIHRTCWCFTTKGMDAVGQDEIVVLLETLPEENQIPYDIFYHLMDIYEDAGRGNTVSGMGHTVFTRSFLGSKDHGGFLFLHPSFQCLQRIPLPPSPFLFAVLLQKWEIPWAKVFPLRLLLRLGAEFRYYPAPLVGVRFRKSVYCEIGHTIMNLLADFRNYQYSLPSVPGLLIHMEDKGTYINFPRNRYDEVVKALNSSIDHVLALAASFSAEADSHLVCIQNDDGNYQTQAINIKDKPRRVTGGSFVVFNGALKPSSGLTAKSSIVEDGLMMQISGESMQALRQALRDMKDYVIPCGPIGTDNPDEVVSIRWVDDDRNINVGVKSPIDGKAMDGVSSIRIHSGTDYVGNGHLIRWTEVFLVKTDDLINSRRTDPVDVSKISDTLAQACCMALVPHLGNLYEAGHSKIGLRVTLDADNVGYEIGSQGNKLATDYMNDLDSELVPAMHCAASPNQEGAVVLELIFHVLQQ